MGADRPVRVLAVDDQEVFRRVVRGLIAATPGFEQVGEAASGPEALELVAELHPDLVLIDVRMPGMDGIETARRVAEVDDRAVVVLTSIEALPELPPAVSSGDAEAYIRKQDLTTSALHEVWKAHSPSAG